MSRIFFKCSRTLHGKLKSDDAVNPETTRRIWSTGVRTAIWNGHFPRELSFEEFQEAMKLVKLNIATGRDNVPGTILHLLFEATSSFCTMLWWKDWQGARTLTSRTGQGVWF